MTSTVLVIKISIFHVTFGGDLVYNYIKLLYNSSYFLYDPQWNMFTLATELGKFMYKIGIEL